jgi:hypothetical protein
MVGNIMNEIKKMRIFTNVTWKHAINIVPRLPEAKPLIWK